MSDDERKGDDEIDLKHLQEEIEMVKGWGVRHNVIIEDIKDSIRVINEKIRVLETGNTGNHNGRSRRRNPRNRPALPPATMWVGGRRTRRRRRKKHTRRRGKKGGHAGGRQYTYTELAAMREAEEDRVYYLYIINTNYDPSLVAPVGNGFTHEFLLNTNGDKIAITGHRVGHQNQNPAYTIPNPANNNIPPAIEVANNFYNPAPGVSREFRDISDIMGNLQMGGRRKKRTRRRKSRGKSRRRMRGKRKGKTRRKRRR